MHYLLVVEDDAAFAATIIDILYEELEPTPVVSHAHTLAEALPIVQQEPIDLAIVDLSLPDAHDLTSVSILRQHKPVLPIVVVTGSQDPVLRQRVRSMTAVGWLHKTGHLSRDDLIAQCRLTMQAGRYLQEAQTLTDEPRTTADSHLTAAREASARWEKIAVVLLGIVYGLLVSVASWAHLTLKSDHEKLKEAHTMLAVNHGQLIKELQVTTEANRKNIERLEGMIFRSPFPPP